MELQLYADESGIHDETGASRGSKRPVVAGFVGEETEWTAFNARWGAVLKEFGAPHFHYSEWTTASSVANKRRSPPGGNPYAGWGNSKLNSFILELARVVGTSNLLPLAKAFRGSEFFEDRQSGAGLPADAERYDYFAYHFVLHIRFEIEWKRPNWKRWTLNTTFHRTDNRVWKAALRNALAHFSTVPGKSGFLTTPPKFLSDKKHFQLQAADMLAYRFNKFSSALADSTRRIPVLYPADEFLLPEPYSIWKRFKEWEALQVTREI